MGTQERKKGRLSHLGQAQESGNAKHGFGKVAKKGVAWLSAPLHGSKLSGLCAPGWGSGVTGRGVDLQRLEVGNEGRPGRHPLELTIRVRQKHIQLRACPHDQAPQAPDSPLLQ